VEEYESFVSELGKPNLLILQFSRSGKHRNQRVMQQQSRLSTLAALERERPRDGNIDLASITCLVQFNRIKIMKCELYVWVFEFVSPNEVGKERERCRADKPNRKPPNLALRRTFGSEDGGFRLLEDTNGVCIKYLALGRYSRVAARSREKFQAKFVLQIGYSLTDRGLSNVQPA
jgi:hypothetical protein